MKCILRIDVHVDNIKLVESGLALSAWDSTETLLARVLYYNRRQRWWSGSWKYLHLRFQNTDLMLISLTGSSTQILIPDHLVFLPLGPLLDKEPLSPSSKQNIRFILLIWYLDSLDHHFPLTKHIPARVTLSISFKVSSFRSATLVDIVTCGLSTLRWLTATTRFR